MTNAFPDDVNEAAKSLASNWITASEFEGGLTLQLRKQMEKMSASNPKYGATADNFLVKKEILSVGETFRYHFTTPDGQEKQIDSTSAPLFIGLRQVEDLKVGDWLKITRTGKTSETRFTVDRVEPAKDSNK